MELADGITSINLPPLRETPVMINVIIGKPATDLFSVVTSGLDTTVFLRISLATVIY